MNLFRWRGDSQLRRRISDLPQFILMIHEMRKHERALDHIRSGRFGVNPSRWRRNSLLRRRLVLGVYGVLLLTLAGTTVGLVESVLSSSHGSFSERLAEAGDWLTGGTLALAATAGLVALQAYASATGPPRLKFRVAFDGSYNNRPAFNVERLYSRVWGIDLPPVARITLRNVSGYSARNPGLVVRLEAMFVMPTAEKKYQLGDGWSIIEASGEMGAYEMQWDGGPIYSIHGYSMRHISLDLTGLVYLPELGQPSFSFELLAEGYRREVTTPAMFILGYDLVDSTPDGDVQIKPVSSPWRPEWI